MALTWTAAGKKVGNDALLAKLQTGSGTAAWNIYTVGASLLATLAIDTTTSSVNASTGQLTLVPDADETDANAGTASYAELVAEDGAILLTGLPVVQGNSPVANSLVISSTEIVAGSTVSCISATIG